MPREDSIAETAKQRSLRVPLDHFVKRDWIVNSKFVLSGVAAGVAAVYIAWLFLAGQAGRHQASPGALAAVHSAWDNDCQECHQVLQPLRSDAVHLMSLGKSPAEIRDSLDQACIKCHNEPEHHYAAKPDELMSCAACHRDHLGVVANIVRPADNNCLRCHRQINQHIDQERKSPSAMAGSVKDVTGFGPAPEGREGPHPEFRSLQNGDPGNIKFNHWLHMQPGAAAKNAKLENKKKLTDLEERFRPQYEQYAKGGGLIELDCAACHVPDANGHYMEPIAYEQHCRACHPLRLEVGQGQPAAEVAHGLTAASLAAAVDGLLDAALKKQQSAAPQTADESGATPLIPGRTLGHNLAQKINQEMRAGAAKAITLQCQGCHEMSAGSEPLATLSEVLPSNIPTQWFRHARFDHNAHRHLPRGCKECHERAYDYEQQDKPPQFIKPTSGAALAVDSEKVMIEGLYNCADCHAANPTNAAAARYDCAECHNYHDRDKLIGVKLTSLTHSMPGSAASSLAGFPVRVHHALNAASVNKASSLGGQQPRESPGASSLPARGELRLASFMEQADSTAAETVSSFVGAGSCASVGCHGDAQPTAPWWRASLTKFFASDPHAQAYDVLWTFRGREMTRLLAAPSKTDDQLSDAAHFQAIQQRCIGCHATPLPQGAIKSPDSYALGVQCESCHGAASEWLHSHYQTNFARTSHGFVDTKQLDKRAGVCMACHVGPNDTAEATQVVDHDLIAAGHPRLAFEFHAYFQNLPPHWNREADEKAHNNNKEYPGAFHFRSWLAGQSEIATHNKLLLARDEKLLGERLNDFSNLDCFACHHSLKNAAWRQQSSFTSLKPAAWPLRELSKLGESTLQSQRLRIARELVEDTAQDPRWDTALQTYLAVRAITSDIPTSDGPAQSADFKSLESALSSLASYLADTSFASRQRASHQPTLYDSPRDHSFDALTQRTDPVLQVLRRLETQNSAR